MTSSSIASMTPNVLTRESEIQNNQNSQFAQSTHSIKKLSTLAKCSLMLLAATSNRLTQSLGAHASSTKAHLRSPSVHQRLLSENLQFDVPEWQLPADTKSANPKQGVVTLSQAALILSNETSSNEASSNETLALPELTFEESMMDYLNGERAHELAPASLLSEARQRLAQSPLPARAEDLSPINATLFSFMNNEFIKQSNMIEDHIEWHQENGSGGTRGPGSGIEFADFHRGMLHDVRRFMGGLNQTIPVWTEFRGNISNIIPLPEGVVRSSLASSRGPFEMPTFLTREGGEDVVGINGRPISALNDIQTIDELWQLVGEFFHGVGHITIGGTMSGFESPRDAIFPTWHGRLDLITDEFLQTDSGKAFLETEEGQAWFERQPYLTGLSVPLPTIEPTDGGESLPPSSSPLSGSPSNFPSSSPSWKSDFPSMIPTDQPTTLAPTTLAPTTLAPTLLTATTLPWSVSNEANAQDKSERAQGRQGPDQSQGVKLGLGLSVGALLTIIAGLAARGLRGDAPVVQTSQQQVKPSAESQRSENLADAEIDVVEVPNLERLSEVETEYNV